MSSISSMPIVSGDTIARMYLTEKAIRREIFGEGSIEYIDFECGDVDYVRTLDTSKSINLTTEGVYVQTTGGTLLELNAFDVVETEDEGEAYLMNIVIPRNTGTQFQRQYEIIFMERIRSHLRRGFEDKGRKVNQLKDEMKDLQSLITKVGG